MERPCRQSFALSPLPITHSPSAAAPPDDVVSRARAYQHGEQVVLRLVDGPTTQRCPFARCPFARAIMGVKSLPPEIYDDIIAQVHGTITLKHLALTSFTTRAAVLSRLFQRLSISLGDTDAIERLARQVSPHALAAVHTLAVAVRIEDEGITDNNIKLTLSNIGYIVHQLVSLKAVEVNLVVPVRSFDRQNISAFVNSTLFDVYCRTVRTLQSLRPLLIAHITLWDQHCSRSLITASDDWRDILQWPGRHTPAFEFSQYNVYDPFTPFIVEHDDTRAEQRSLSIRSFIRCHNLRHLPTVQKFGVITRLDLNTTDLEDTASACLAVTKKTLQVLFLQDWSDGPVNLGVRIIELPALAQLRIKHATIPFGLVLLQTFQCPRLKDLDIGFELARGQAQNKPRLLYSSIAAFFQTSRAMVNVLVDYKGTIADWKELAPAFAEVQRKLLPSGCCMALAFSSINPGQGSETVNCFNLATSSALQSSMTSLKLCIGDFANKVDYKASPGTYPKVRSCRISRRDEFEIEQVRPALDDIARSREDARIEAESSQVGETIKYILWLHRMPHLQRLHIDIVGLHYECALLAILASLGNYSELHELQVDISPPGGEDVDLALPTTFVDQCAQIGVTAVDCNIIKSRSLAYRERRRRVQKLQE